MKCHLCVTTSKYCHFLIFFFMIRSIIIKCTLSVENSKPILWLQKRRMWNIAKGVNWFDTEWMNSRNSVCCTCMPATALFSLFAITHWDYSDLNTDGSRQAKQMVLYNHGPTTSGGRISNFAGLVHNFLTAQHSIHGAEGYFGPQIFKSPQNI